MNGAGAPEPEDTFGHALVGETIAGRLVVDKVLGAGAMGVVVSAKHPELAQRVAIKLLRPELARLPHVAARFLREARLAASVQSVNLVRVHDTGKHEGRIPYIVMELLSGQPLNEELERRGPFAPELAADTIVQVCAGLAELHARGVVHRDIKPNNLFVTKVAGVRTIKVLDFGISTAQQPTRNTIHDDDEPPLTLSEAILGTPQYMAPEQIRDPRNVDARSDIWSLGVVLYQLLTGTLPFAPTDGAVGEIFGLIMFQDPAPPSSRTGAVPKDLESVVLRCLQRDRDARFQSVAELATALLPFMAPASQHRVEGVRHALHASDLPPSMPAGTSPPNAGMDFGTARTELPEIQSTRPQAARYEQSPAATESRDSLDAGATAHSVRDLRATQPSAGSGRAPRAPAVRRRSLVALGAAMFLIAPVTPLSVGALRNQSVTSKSTPSKLPSLKTSDAPAAATGEGAPWARLEVRAYIDGRSRLVLQGNSARWDHRDWSAPGRWRGADLPTYFNAEPLFPAWPDRSLGTENKDCNCESSSMALAQELAPSGQRARIESNVGRGSVSIAQQPSAANGNALVIEIIDPPEGADWYQFVIVYPTLPL